MKVPQDMLEKLQSATDSNAGFVAINEIRCKPDYIQRFESLFQSRAHAIDRMQGFLWMHVLKAVNPEDPYLVVSYWKDKQSFDEWVGSPEFLEGHKRAFEDMKHAKERGEEPPMTSNFRTYSLLTN